MQSIILGLYYFDGIYNANSDVLMQIILARNMLQKASFPVNLVIFMYVEREWKAAMQIVRCGRYRKNAETHQKLKLEVEDALNEWSRMTQD